VTCRIAAHHFPSVEAFVDECRRVLVPGGILALADNVVSGEAKVAKYVNGFEQLRDPSHHWAYSLDDWQAILFAGGFTTLHVETLEKSLDFVDWTDRMGVRGDDMVRLRAMLVQAPAHARAWLRPREEAGRLIFTLTEMVSVSRKG
jgi:SAM-dependent methyltransferase